MPTNESSIIQMSKNEETGQIEYSIEVPQTVGQIESIITNDLLTRFFNLANFKRQKGFPSSLKEFEQSPAILYVISRKTKFVQYMTNKFFLTDIQESKQELAQVIETFGGDSSLFFFGEKTKIYKFGGQLFETGNAYTKTPQKYLWASSLHDLYEKHARATQCAQAGNEILLSFKNAHLFGYITNLNIAHSSQNNNLASFSFTMIVREHKLLNEDIDELYSIRQILDKAEYREQVESLDQTIKENLHKQLVLINDSYQKAILRPSDLFPSGTNTLYSVVGHYIRTGNIEEYLNEDARWINVENTFQNERKQYKQYQEEIKEARETFYALFQAANKNSSTPSESLEN